MSWDQYLYVEDKDGNQDRIGDSMEVYDGQFYFHKLGDWGVDLTQPRLSLDCQTRAKADKAKVVMITDDVSEATDFWYQWKDKLDEAGETTVDKNEMAHEDLGE